MNKFLLVFIALTLVSCGTKVIHGPPGENGVSCSATSITADPISAPAGGVLIKCGNSSPIMILNGVDGKDGADGRDGIDGVDGTDAVFSFDLLYPCGNKGPHDEVLLRSGTTVLAAFIGSTIDRIRLTKLEPNAQYQTSDGNACWFKIDEDGNLIDSTTPPLVRTPESPIGLTSTKCNDLEAGAVCGCVPLHTSGDPISGSNLGVDSSRMFTVQYGSNSPQVATTCGPVCPSSVKPVCVKETP